MDRSAALLRFVHMCSYRKGDYTYTAVYDRATTALTPYRRCDDTIALRAKDSRFALIMLSWMSGFPLQQTELSRSALALESYGSRRRILSSGGADSSGRPVPVVTSTAPPSL